MLLTPQAFEAAFHDEAAAESGGDRPRRAIDAQTARRRHDAKPGLGPRHVVTAWAGESGLALGQEAGAETSRETTAIPGLLSTIDVPGGAVTIAARDAQEAIAAEVLRGRADSVRVLQGHPESRPRAVIEPGAERLEGDGARAAALTTADRGPGRAAGADRPAPAGPEGRPGTEPGEGLQSVGVVTARPRGGATERLEIRSARCSLPAEAQRLARAVGATGSGTNACPWTLAVTAREDDAWVRQRRRGRTAPGCTA